MRRRCRRRNASRNQAETTRGAKAKKSTKKPKKNCTSRCAPTLRTPKPIHVYAAAARLWVDAIIDPAHTREALIGALEAAALNPYIARLQDRSATDLITLRTRVLIYSSGLSWAAVLYLFTHCFFQRLDHSVFAASMQLVSDGFGWWLCRNLSRLPHCCHCCLIFTSRKENQWPNR